MPDKYKAAEADYNRRLEGELQAARAELEAMRRRETELNTERARLQATLAAMPLAIRIADAEGRIIEANEQTKVIWGEPALRTENIKDYAAHRGWWPDTGEPLQAEDWALVRALAKGETIVGEEINIQRFDGSFGTIVNNAAPIRGAEGRIIGGVVIEQDVTARRRAEAALRASEEKFVKAFADNPAAITLTRASDGQFIDVNDGFVRLSGYRREEAIGRTSLDLQLWPSAEARESFVRELLDTGIVHSREQEFRIKTGKVLVTELSAQALKMQGETMVLSTIVDMTDRKRWEKELHAEQQLLRTVVETVPTGLIFADHEGNFRFVSPSAMRLFGGPATGTAAGPDPGSYEMLKVDGTPFTTEEMPLVRAVRSGEAVPDVEIVIVRADGSRVTLLTDTVPTRDAQGRVSGAVVAMQDISERKRREADSALIADVNEQFARMNSLDDIMTGMGEKIGRYLRVKVVAFSEMDETGDVARVTHGWRNESAPPLPHDFRISAVVTDRFSEADRLAKVIVVRDTKKDPRMNGPACDALGVGSFVAVTHHERGGWKECLILTDGGPRDWCNDEINLVREVGERIFRRIDRMRADEAIRTSERDLAESNRRLQEANEELEWFGRYLSHDLRAPLRTVREFTQILREDYADKLGSDGSDLIDLIIGGANQAVELISDIQRLTGLDAIRIEREEIDLSQIVQEWHAQLQRRDAGPECRMRCKGDLTVHADRRLMTVALTNLLENAYKFANGKSSVEIEVGSRPGRERMFYVKDNGAGFDMERAEQLFRPFSRLHSFEAYPGTGLGLVIVRRVVSKHGGRIWAESEPGKGATFWFTVGP